MQQFRQVGLTLLAIAMSSQVAIAQDDDRNLTIVLTESVRTLEPCETTAQVIGLITKQNIIESLTEISPTDGSITPRLATSWEAVGDDTWRFHLREGVQFSDGAPFNAEAVVTAAGRFFNPAIDPCNSRARFFSDSKFEFTAVDEHTLDIKATPPDPILPLRMSQLLVTSPNTPFDERTNVPIGTGPYVLVSYTPEESVVIARAPSYWGELPEPDGATYVWRTEASVRAAMGATGEADIALDLALPDATNPETDLPYFNSETTRIRIALNQPPLTDERVREAITLAIDREAFVGTLLHPMVEYATQTILPSVFGYKKDLPQPTYDPERAKQLLAEARADGVPVDAPIRFINRSSLFANATEFAEALAAMLTEIGLNVTFENLETTQWIAEMERPEDSPQPVIFVDQIDNNMGDAIFSMFTRYHSGGSVADFDSDVFDEIYSRALGAGGEEREKAFHEAFQLVHDSVIELPLFHMVNVIRVSPRLAFTPTMALVQELQLGQVSFKD